MDKFDKSIHSSLQGEAGHHCMDPWAAKDIHHLIYVLYKESALCCTLDLWGADDGT